MMRVAGCNRSRNLTHSLWLALHEFFPYPTGILATIEYSRNQDLVFKDLIINGEWKPLGEKSMVPEDYRMDALEI